MRGLIIKRPWIDYTLNGLKPFEIRTRPTNIRERIGLVCAGTGEVWGEADLAGCSSPIYAEHYVCSELMDDDIPWNVRVEITNWLFPPARKCAFHIMDNCNGCTECSMGEELYIWEFDNITRYGKPRPYIHPQGAQTWIRELKFIKE